MSIYIFNRNVVLFFCLLIAIMTGCGKKEEKKKTETEGDVWDIEKKGIPKFVGTNYIELEKIYRISKFRSSIGHDYSDAFEHCRSMKHYFEPKGDIDWSTIKIFSPVTGIITRAEMEWAGLKLEIASTEHPAFRFSIFHINSPVPRNINDTIVEGEQLGTHIGMQTMSDISVIVNDSTHQGRMISYFDVMTDTLFNEYTKRGVNSREEMIIPKQVRDSVPLICSGETFVSADTLENWVILK